MKSWTRQIIGLALLALALVALAAWTDTATPEEPFSIGALLAPPAHALRESACNNAECQALKGSVIDIAFWNAGSQQCTVYSGSWVNSYQCHYGGGGTGGFPTCDNIWPDQGSLCNNPGCNNWDPHSCCFGVSNECDSVYLPGA